MKKAVDKGIAYLKRNGFRGFVRRLIRKAALARPVNYEKWLRRHSVSASERKEQEAVSGNLKVRLGVCLVGADEKRRQATKAALTRQTFGKWKEISTVKDWLKEQKENTKSGGTEERAYLLVIRAGTLLEPDALFVFAEQICRRREVPLFYADHDELLGAKSKTGNPNCKPQFDLYYLRSCNYIGHGFCLSQSLAEKVGELDLSKGEGVFYDYLLRCGEVTENAFRIPRILFHQEQIPEQIPEEMQALKEHFLRLGVDAQVGETNKKGIYTVRYGYGEEPLVSIVIPNKDYAGQLTECVESILQNGGYENMEILIVENNSREEETFRCYDRLKKKDARVRVLTWQGDFQYSRINNDAVKEAKGDYFLFLNNDTKMRGKGCLAELMNVGRMPDVGAVGAQMFYGDDTIQHAGVILGYGGIAGHAFEGMEQKQYEALPFVPAVRQFSAVTAACMLVKREAFLAAGGFSETLGIAYNDIDLCLTMRERGWKVLYCPQARLYHYESQTRGLEMTREKAQRVLREQKFFQEKWKRQLEEGDPFYHPLLTLEKADFSLKP